MRLTLRTMLAYLDDILEPDDHAEIGKKIEESDYASDLVRRTRDVMLRMRLGAPHVMGQGMGLDANTVAEYLDNTMPPERVADFEKVCLESDVHLAEAAACHQILTLVLGQPANVPPALRQRMYEIPAIDERSRKDADDEQAAKSGIASALASASVAPPPAPESNAPQRAKPEVPDYLRESRRSRRKMAIFGVLAAGLAAVIVTLAVNPDAFGPLLGKSGGVNPAEREAAVEGGEAPSWEPPKVDLGQSTDVTTDGNGPTPEPGTSGETTPPPAISVDTPQLPADGGQSPTAEPALPATGLEPAPPADGGPMIPPGSTPETAPDAGAPGTDPTLPPDGAAPAEAAPNNPLPTEPPAGAGDEPAGPGEVASIPPGATPPIPTDPVPADPAATPDAAPVNAGPVGAYVSDKDVLLRFDNEQGIWQRLPPRAPLRVGDQLLALPTFRPTIALETGFTVQLSGGTSIRLTAPAADGARGFDIQHGRAIIVSVGPPGGQLRLGLGPNQYTAIFGDANSTLAVQVRRMPVLGADPEAAPAPVKVDVYNASGRIVWNAAGESAETVGPAHWQIPAAEVADAEVQLPEWINSEPLSATDRRASIALEEALQVDKPLSLVLSELVEGRRIEVRSLAARCSVYVGQFEPFVASLNDADQRAAWGLHIEALRNALALSPQVAGRVREAFVAKRGDQGPALYRMVWGYSEEDLKAGADKRLVAALDHPQLDFRVLAFWNLRTITGLGLNYRPEYPADRREQSIRRWKDRLAAGEVRYTSSVPLPPEQPSEPAPADDAEPPKSSTPDLLDGLRELQE